ncbi:MAG: protein kinase [Herpetosiphonaceae bacterium]|nr:protein kinase [Herpetosiphonaceae bacterium]
MIEQRSVINTPRAIGNYLLEAELGRGATSLVWRGRHRFLREREVAVKILLSQDEESTMRFGREAELTAQLRHPHIVAVYDHGQAGNFLYTIMELVSGGSLRQYMAKHQRLSLKEAFSIFRQIGTALDFAHSQGIVHRDVAPGNVLLESAGGRALLTDFGIARQPQQSHTTTHIIMGTPGFFSPEHAQSATAVTAVSDLYGLGVIFYFMLTGELPWQQQPSHPDYVFGNILPLGARGVDLPPEIDKIFQTLLAIDPKKRYPTAAAATEAIDRALQRAGVLLDRSTPLPEVTAFRAINTASTYQSAGVLESEVEAVLGPDLVREPVERAHARAERLRDPLALAKLLDQWSMQGKFWEFRRQHLGRIINLRSVSSRNVYFYQMHVLLETRTPPNTIEEPDTEETHFKVQREQDRWTMKLPKPHDWSDDPGKTEIIPGSERVLKCERCNGEGQAVCNECKGTRRVLRTVAVNPGQPADMGVHEQTTVSRRKDEAAAADGHQVEMKQTLVPCPTCGGAGALRCELCQGVGRLVQRKVFQWHRTAVEHAAHDDLPNLDEDALRHEVALTQVYNERSKGLKREWSEVQALQPLLAQVNAKTGVDTRVVLAEITVQMIPYTEVEFDHGHHDVVLEENEPAPPSDDRIHRLQLAGFEDKVLIPAGTDVYDNARRLQLFGLIFLAVIVVLYTAYIFIAR